MLWDISLVGPQGSSHRCCLCLPLSPQLIPLLGMIAQFPIIKSRDSLPKGILWSWNPFYLSVASDRGINTLPSSCHPVTDCINTPAFLSLRWNNSKVHDLCCFPEFPSRMTLQLSMVEICLISSFSSLSHFPPPNQWYLELLPR